MSKTIQLHLTTELLWWLMALIVATLAALPIYPYIIDHYVYFTAILAFVVAKEFRFILFYRKAPYLQPLWVKIILSMAIVTFVPWMLVQLQHFYFQMDDYDPTIFLKHAEAADAVALEAQYNAYKLFKRLFLFLSIASMMLSVAFLLRIIGSLWKSDKRKKRKKR